MADVANKWPELVGKTKEEAEAAIKAARPDVTVEFVEDGSMVSMDFKTDRVRVFYNGEGNVAQPPRTG